MRTWIDSTLLVKECRWPPNYGMQQSALRAAADAQR